MINIFISRPTWITEEFQEGLNGFLSFLDTHDIKPRTLGSTDYPTESPLDEVISIMDECKGVIVLGYPQIYVTKGKIKEVVNSDFLLPTEWNHIEAALAYIKKLPLLIIHHKGIARGIFAHGAISKFIYERDLSKTNWFLSDNVKGALRKWKSSIKTSETISPRSAPMLAPKTAPLPTPKPSPSQGRLEKDVESILIHLFNQSRDQNRDPDSIIRKFECNKQAALYYIDVFLSRKMIATAGQWNNGDHFYSFTAKGREYVMTNKLALS